MPKVGIFDKRIFKRFLEITSIVSAAVSTFVIFYDIPKDCKYPAGGLFLAGLAITYIVIWRKANSLREIDIKIDESSVTIKAGDLFKQGGLKVISFNEYFDTQVDNKIISEKSLNGIFIKNHLPSGLTALENHLERYSFEPEDISGNNATRRHGKRTKYQLGTVCEYGEFLLTAFAKFDDHDRAVLTMPEYLEFLINFWDRVNRIYAMRSVSTPIFGSGITRIKGHKTISDEDLLKIMLWTFRISEMRFTYPARLTIIIHQDKIDQVNLLDIKSARNGV